MRKIFSFLKGKFVLERKNKCKNRIKADFSAVWFDDCTALFFSTKKEEKTIEISTIGNKCQFYTKSRAPPRSVWIRLKKFKLNGERILNINVNVNINVNFDSLEEFKKFCKVLYLEREYPNHLGNADWLIISDLSEEEIQRRFSEVLSKSNNY